MVREPYICPICQNEEHPAGAKFCCICGAPIEIENEPDESTLFNSADIAIEQILQAKGEEIIANREPIGLFYMRNGGRYIGIDNRTGDAWTEDFALMDECKEWLTRVVE